MTITLGPLDALVLCASLAAVVVIGLRVGRRSRDMESYLLGGRDLPWWAILGSIVATETSTATVLSVPGEAFGPSGMRFLQLAMGYILGRLIVARILLPLYFEGKLFTAYQVLQRRFGLLTRKSASLLFLVARNLGDGLRLFLAAIVLQELLGWPFAFSIVVMGLVTMLYTWFGGMRSVVWNDCIQMGIYLVGGIASVFIIAANIPGGWDELFSFMERTGKWRVIEPGFSLAEPYTIWAGLIGGAVLTIGTHGTDHMFVQRYLSARSRRDASRAVILSGVVVLFQFALFLFIGVQLACYYAGRPEIVFEKNDRVFAHFIVNFFPQNTGLVGLMLAAILAAAMSTLSSSLNASASAVVNDFYLARRRDAQPPPPERLLAISRWLTLAFGCLQIGIGFWALQLADTVVRNALTIAGFSAGLLLGIFSLGVLTRRVGQVSALIGATAGLAVLLFVQFGPWKVAFPWLALTGAASIFLVGYSASFIWPRHTQ